MNNINMYLDELRNMNVNLTYFNDIAAKLLKYIKDNYGEESKIYITTSIYIQKLKVIKHDIEKANIEYYCNNKCDYNDNEYIKYIVCSTSPFNEYCPVDYIVSVSRKISQGIDKDIEMIKANFKNELEGTIHVRLLNDIEEYRIS